LAPPGIFFATPRCWAVYGPGDKLCRFKDKLKLPGVLYDTTLVTNDIRETQL